jgi:hypothetical protein
MADEFLMRAAFAATYLERLLALAKEMNIAMSAIAENALSSLEESIATQELLCSSLSTMRSAAQHEMRTAMPEVLPGQPSDAVTSEIWAASTMIRGLNLRYASLLKHSGRSIALFSALCKSHTGQFQEARGSRLKHQTWSCEI